MNYAQILLCDIANGIGCRTSLFVSGCTHHCKGCFNEIAWDFNYGKPFDDEVQDKLIKETDHTYINGLTILGGEPMEIVNQKVLRPFIERFKQELPKKTIWIYSGYTWEELTDVNNKRCHCDDTDKILSMTDVLVDGKFELDLKNISLRFRGSSNQRVINVPKTLSSGEVILSIYYNNEK